MRKLFLFFIGLCLAASLQAQVAVTSKAGGLYAAMKAQQINPKTVSWLIVGGTIDARDFVILRDSMPALATLVLGDATIEAYTGAGTDLNSSIYNKNTIPALAFNTNFTNTVLTNLVLPSSITEIDKLAFAYCSSIKAIEIPVNVTVIGEGAFAACAANFTVAGGNNAFVVDGGVLFNSNKTTLIACPISISGTYSVPATVTRIAAYAFHSCAKITAINATSVTEIGNNAFQISGLTSFIIPAGVTTIEAETFNNCASLKTVKIPLSVTTINEGAFAFSHLEDIAIPSSVTTMGIGVFSTCTYLATVEFKALVSKLDENLFSNCSNLKSINFPATAISVGKSALNACRGLTKLSIPASVQGIDANAFSGCTSLQTLIINNSTPVTITMNEIYGIPATKCILFVPRGSKKAYQADKIWGTFKQIVEMPRIVESDTLYVPATATKGAIRFIIPTSNWTARNVSSPYGMLSFNQQAVNGEDSIPGTVTENKGKERMATIAVSNGGDFSQRVYIIQDTVVKVNKQMLDTTINVSDVSTAWPLAPFFSYLGKGTLSYSVSSDNESVATAVVHGSRFALVPYRAGKANITITATSSRGGVGYLTFVATVAGSVVANCNISIDRNITPVSCAGSNTGAIELLVMPSTGVYTYKWSNSCSDKKNINLAAGIYSVVVRDTMGCTATKTFILPNPRKMTIAASVSDTKCGVANGQIILDVKGGTGTYTYKWNVASSVPYIAKQPRGTYSVTVTDGNKCEQTESFIINDSAAPLLALDSVKAARCSKAIGAVYVTAVGGSATDTYKWSNNATTPDLTNVLPGTYTLTLTATNQCVSILTATVPTKRFAQPKIALVTVGEQSQKNVVVWLKDKTDAISHYTIYREDGRNNYKPLGMVAYNAISTFVDNEVDPAAQSYRYRITASDSCKNESPQSKEYKTMHIDVKQTNKQKIVLNWDDYEGAGFYAFGISYLNANNVWQTVATLPASITRFVSPMSEVNKKYRVQILFDEITANALKSDTGPFSQSLSNMSEASLVSTSSDAQSAGIVYPNPTSDIFTVDVEDATSVTVSNLDGKVLIAEKVSNKQSVSIANLSKGAYIVSIQSKQGTVKQTIIKN